ncbi:hypothetical protein Leryth_000336 [Lithospermum erythrorhizon]|nr:hypothetical protein Leryth_000336 [Lithospermum erythrorhizon]
MKAYTGPIVPDSKESIGIINIFSLFYFPLCLACCRNLGTPIDQQRTNFLLLHDTNYQTNFPIANRSQLPNKIHIKNESQTPL